MHRSRHPLAPGLWLDARRAVWLEEDRALVVADTHLGYAWAHRQRGNLLPIGAGDDTIDRLHKLVADYAPRELVILGDVIHASAAAPAVADDLRQLHAFGANVRLIRGNHDRDLAAMLAAAGLASDLVESWPIGAHLLLHGDMPDVPAAERHCAEARARSGRVILGHEHPAISLSDGVATSARCPCFLVGDGLLVLPAFTGWASGTDVRGRSFMSPFLQRAALSHAIAIVAGKLLPIPL